MVFFIIGLYHFRRDFHVPAPLYILNPNFLWNDTSFVVVTFSLCMLEFTGWSTHLLGRKEWSNPVSAFLIKPWGGAQECGNWCPYSAACGEEARNWVLLPRKPWGKGEGKSSFCTSPYNTFHLNRVFFIHFHYLIWSLEPTQKKGVSSSIVEMRLWRLKVFVKGRAEAELGLTSEVMMAEFRTLACATLPPTGRGEKCSFISRWFWMWNLVFKSLGSVRCVKRDVMFSLALSSASRKHGYCQRSLKDKEEWCKMSE